jgi:sugar/nucleoside kinase (ribokinase family)
MKEFHVCGLGNAIVDLFLDLSDEEFARVGFDRGTMRLVDKDEQAKLLAAFHDTRHDLRLVSGGSVANSVIALSQLGGRGAFIGVVGDDRYGLHYAGEFDQLGIDIGSPVLAGETTGTSICVITPDAERTMRTCLGVSSQLAARHVDADRVAASEWLFVEGYVFANPDTGQHAIREAIRVAKAAGTKVALTCSEAFVPQAFAGPFREALADADLLFCNAAEAQSVAGAATAAGAFETLRGVVPSCVVTDGPNGAFVRFGGRDHHVPAFPCTPKDLTGAGDMFAGAFLYGVTHGVPPDRAARGANFLASKVISQVGARLHHGAKGYWAEAV